MRLETIKRIQILAVRQAYALEREDIDYYQELLENRELCIKTIKQYNEENNSPFTDEELQILEFIKIQDENNKQILENQFENIKVKLKNIRINETRSMQYARIYDSWQESSVFFDKK